MPEARSNSAPDRRWASSTLATVLGESAQLSVCASADGADFASMAEEHSVCPSRKQGGSMGWVDPAIMSPVLAEAAFQADIGELVQAESRHGLHLIHVEAERCAQLLCCLHGLLPKSPVLVTTAILARAWCSVGADRCPAHPDCCMLLHSACCTISQCLTPPCAPSCAGRPPRCAR